MLEQLNELADQLRSKQPIAPAALDEQAVRLLAGVVMLLRQYNLSKRNQCQFCAASRRLHQRRRGVVVDSTSEEPVIHTQRGVGYSLRAPGGGHPG